MTTISDFMNQNTNDTPFPQYDIDKDAYRPIEQVLNQPLEIYEAKLYTNDKGDGVFILALTDDNEFIYIATHAIGLVSVMSQPAVQNYLAADGCTIRARIIKRKSKTSNRMVYDFTD